MPKSTHESKKEATNKFRSDDEKIYEQDKQEFQGSEKAKKADGAPQESSMIPGEKEQE